MNKKPIRKNPSEAILALFEDGDDALLLTPGCESDIVNMEPMDGLRLATMTLGDGYAEALRERNGAYADQTSKEGSVGDDHPRLKQTKKALRKLTKKTKDWFVLCYRLEDDTGCHMAWSANIDEYQAFNIVLGYIQYLTLTVSYDEGDDLPADNPFPLMT